MTPERLRELREKAQPKGEPCGYHHWVGLEHKDILDLFTAVATKNYLLEEVRRAIQQVLERPADAPVIIAEQLSLLSRLYETCGWTGRPEGGSCVDLMNNGGIAGSTGCDLHYPNRKNGR